MAVFTTVFHSGHNAPGKNMAPQSTPLVVSPAEFSSDMATIRSAVTSTKFQTLFFSATLTGNYSGLQPFNLRNPFFFSDKQKTDSMLTQTLQQRFIFVPKKMKIHYLFQLLYTYGPSVEEDVKAKVKGITKAKSAIVFTSTCFTCQLLTEAAREIGIPCV